MQNDEHERGEKILECQQSLRLACNMAFTNVLGHSLVRLHEHNALTLENLLDYDGNSPLQQLILRAGSQLNRMSNSQLRTAVSTFISVLNGRGVLYPDHKNTNRQTYKDLIDECKQKEGFNHTVLDLIDRHVKNIESQNIAEGQQDITPTSSV